MRTNLDSDRDLHKQGDGVCQVGSLPLLGPMIPFDDGPLLGELPEPSPPEPPGPIPLACCSFRGVGADWATVGFSSAPV